MFRAFVSGKGSLHRSLEILFASWSWQRRNQGGSLHKNTQCQSLEVRWTHPFRLFRHQCLSCGALFKISLLVTKDVPRFWVEYETYETYICHFFIIYDMNMSFLPATLGASTQRNGSRLRLRHYLAGRKRREDILPRRCPAQRLSSLKLRI